MTSPHQQKLRITGPVIITANRLVDGAVVHRTSKGEWSEVLQDAQILTEPFLVHQALAEAQNDNLKVVGAYVAPVNRESSDVEPGNLRENIRAHGPTFSLPADIPTATSSSVSLSSAFRV